MTQEQKGAFASLVEQGVRAYQHAQKLKLIGMTVAYIAQAAAIGVSTLNSWRSQTARRIPCDYHVLQRFAKVCVEGAPELDVTWIHALFLEAGMAGYCNQAIDAILPNNRTKQCNQISSANDSATEKLTVSMDESRSRKLQLGVVPLLPTYYVARPAYLDVLKATIRRVYEVGGCISIAGMTGIGKTTLMAAIGHDIEMKALFSDGVRWFDMQERDDISVLLRHIAQSLDTSIPEAVRAIPDILQAVRTQFEGQSLLLLLDDLVKPTLLEALRNLGPGIVVVVTTRRSHLTATLVGAYDNMVKVEPMTEKEAWELVERIVPIKATERDTVARIFHLTTYHPYALVAAAWAASALGMTWADIQMTLASPTARWKLLQFAATSIHNVWAALEVDWQDLDTQCRETLGALVRAYTTSDMMTVLADLGISNIEVTIILKTLASMNFAQPISGQPRDYALHWLVRDFVSEKITQHGNLTRGP